MNAEDPADPRARRITEDAPVTADAIDAARTMLGPAVRRTPVLVSERLSEIAGRKVWLKREDLQAVRSYKIRGALLFLESLTDEERSRGVVAASAGNHAQGVAYASRSLGIEARIYIPSTTPRQKRERITALGGDCVTLILDGETFDDAAERAMEDAERTGAIFVPPFDSPTVMAGQGTVVAEAIEQIEEDNGASITTVVVPVGGGGLLGGCATWLAGRRPDVRVIGAEPAGAASMAAAMVAGHPVTLREIERFIDGAAVRRAGAAPLAATQRTKPQLIAIDEGAVCTEMLELYQVDGIITEPAGALAPAAVAIGEAQALTDDEADGGILVVVSGGNNDVSRYNEIVERSLIHEGLKHYFLVTFAQEPGALRRFVESVLGDGDDIALFDYIKRNNRETGPALVGLELGCRENLEPLLQRMAASDMEIERIDPAGPLYRYIT